MEHSIDQSHEYKMFCQTFSISFFGGGRRLKSFIETSKPFVQSLIHFTNTPTPDAAVVANDVDEHDDDDAIC